MKKILLMTCLLLTVTTFVSAQRAAERKALIAKGLKEDVKLTDQQVTLVTEIENEFKIKQREIKADASLSDEAKKEKTKSLNDEKRKKIEDAIGKDLAKKVETFYSSLKKNDGEEKKDENEKEKKKGSKN